MHDSEVPIYLWRSFHYALIADLNSFASTRLCTACNAFFAHQSGLAKHRTRNRCPADDVNQIDAQGDYQGYKRTFRSGVFQPYKFITDELEEIGVVLPDIRTQLFNPFVLIFDIESLLQRIGQPEDEGEGETLRNARFISKHRPVSICLCSNVPGFELHEHVNFFESSSRFIEGAVEFMIEASKKAEEILHERGAYLFGILELMEEEALTFQKTWMVNKVKRIRKKIETYYKQLRCLTYNGSSYDLVALIREGLCYYIKKHDSLPIAMKASNHYILLASERLRFLDVILFCGNKTSLRNFLRMWLTPSQSSEVGTKLYFPYNALNSFEDLI